MFTGKILFVGFGSIGQALAPVLLTHWGLAPSRVRALAADEDGARVAADLGIAHQVLPLDASNLSAVLSTELAPGDLLINVSVNVSSCALIEWSQAHGVLYLDTCVEPWEGGYKVGQDRGVAQTTNYALREEALTLKGKGRPTAVIAHGANPGVISHLAKAGLLEMAKARGIDVVPGPHAWGRLCEALGVKVLHVAERDTQTAQTAFGNTFVNTWSALGLLSEAWQPAELGWGTHEKTFPADGFRHEQGSRVGVYLGGHSVDVRVKSWVPSQGAQDCYLITHHEALSLAQFLSVPHKDKPAIPAYRPTVYYAYAPCEATQAGLTRWAHAGYATPSQTQVLREELVSGSDQLGVLFVFDGGAFWFGSTVSLEGARQVAPYNNATSLQVVGGMLGALDWMLEHPREGVVEAEELPSDEVLKVARPYLGEVQGYWTAWQPCDAATTRPEQRLQFSSFRI